MKTFNNDELIRLRRYFHSYPELSGQEKNTCKFILKYVQDHTINTKILYSGKYGLIFQNQKSKDYISIGLRSELDALPLQDTKEVEYKSKNDGITHACGHDAHMAILLQLIKDLDVNDYKLNFIYIFQSSEENCSGAKALAMELRKSEIDYLFALHITPNLFSGYFSLSDEICLAANLTKEVTLYLHQGHVGEKESFTNVISHINSYENSYENSYNNSQHICRVTHLSTDGYYNIMPSKIKFYITFRGSNMQTLEFDFLQLYNSIIKLNGILGGEHQIAFKTPELICNSKLVDLTRIVLKKCFGDDKVLVCPFLMSSDDFAYYKEINPTVDCCYFFIGSYLNDKIQVHTSNFDLDETCLYYGHFALKTIISVIDRNDKKFLKEKQC